MTSDDDSAQPQRSSSYPRDLVLPSDRHDNDRLDMTEIVISQLEMRS